MGRLWCVVWCLALFVLCTHDMLVAARATKHPKLHRSATKHKTHKLKGFEAQNVAGQTQSTDANQQATGEGSSNQQQATQGTNTNQQQGEGTSQQQPPVNENNNQQQAPVNENNQQQTTDVNTSNNSNPQQQVADGNNAQQQVNANDATTTEQTPSLDNTNQVPSGNVRPEGTTTGGVQPQQANAATNQVADEQASKAMDMNKAKTASALLAKTSSDGVDDESDDEEDLRKRTYEDLTNLFHSHDAATAPPMPQLPPPVPNPYMYGSASTLLAMERIQTCSPSLFTIEEQGTAGGSASFHWTSLTANDVKKHVLSTLPLTKFAKFPDAPVGNVDGRLNHPVIGAMGGDSGEFLLALNAFEKVLKKPLTKFQVASFLSDFLISSSKSTFALQTDTATLDIFCRRLKFCLPEFRLDNPPPSMLDTLRQEVAKPEFVGCAHLKHMLQQPDKFLVRKELVADYIVAFYNLLWGVPENLVAPRTLRFIRDKLRLQIMQGPHTEGGLLRVNTQACADDHIPMLVPENSGISLAIHHEDGTQLLRRHYAEFLAEQSKKLGTASADAADEDELTERMTAIADTQFQVALAIDSGRLPVFSLAYPGACCMGSMKRSEK